MFLKQGLGVASIGLRGYNEVFHDFLVANKVGFEIMLAMHYVNEKLFDVGRGIGRGFM